MNRLNAAPARHHRVTLALVSLAFLLAGCVKFDADFKISAADNVDMTMLLAVEQQYYGQLAGVCDEGSSSVAGDAEISPYRQDGFVGCTIRASGPLEEVFLGGSGWSTTHENGEYQFLMDNSRTGSQSQLADLMFTTFRVAVAFPGEVTSHSDPSTIQGTTVTWTNAADAFQHGGLKATSKEANTLFAALPWIVGLAVLLGIGVAAAVAVRKRPQ